MHFYLFIEDILVRKIITDFCLANNIAFQELTDGQLHGFIAHSPALFFIDMQARGFNPYMLAQDVIQQILSPDDVVIAITAARYPEVLRKGKNSGLSTFILRSEVTPLLQHILLKLKYTLQTS